MKAEKTRIYQENVKSRLAQKRAEHEMNRERQNLAFEVLYRDL